MASSFFTILRRLNSILEPSRSFSEIVTKNAFASRLINSRSYAAHNLYWKIIRLGKPGSSVVPELDRSVEKGSKIDAVGLPGVIRNLQKRKKHSLAWTKKGFKATGFRRRSNEYTWDVIPGNTIADLYKEPYIEPTVSKILEWTYKIDGLDSAERYFNNLSDQDKNEKTYGALFEYYVRDCLTDKALTHFQKMKEMGFLSSAVYEDLMKLYRDTKQYEKVHELLTEMKQNGFSPSNYKLIIHSYGVRSDLEGMEKFIEEIECQTDVALNWDAYSMVVEFYIEADLVEKAITTLKKMEEKIEQDHWFGYTVLISLYASIGRKDDVLRIWALVKTTNMASGFLTRIYNTTLRSLVKLDEFEEAETVLKEGEPTWKNFRTDTDIDSLNTLLVRYSEKGLAEKANALLELQVKKRDTPPLDSWLIVVKGFVSKDDMRNAFECLKKCLSLSVGYGKWKENEELLTGILGWIGDEGDVESVEAFVSLLKKVFKVNRVMYNTLIKANIREGNDVDDILESMKEDKIDCDEETNKILSTGPKKALA